VRELLGHAISTLFESPPAAIETCTRLIIGAKLSKRIQTEAVEMLSLRLETPNVLPARKCSA
jgi:hypothetical protein